MKKVLCFALMLPFFCVAAALADDGDSSSDRREEYRKRVQEAIKKYDKDDDGKLNDSERRAMFEAMRAQYAERMKQRSADAKKDDSKDDEKKEESRRRPSASPSDRSARGGSGRPSWSGRGPSSQGGDRASDAREEFRKRMQEAVKKYDKDDDGKLDDGERRAMFEAMRKQWAERMQASRGDDKKPDARRPSAGDRTARGGPPQRGGPWGGHGPQASGRRPGPQWGQGGPRPSFGQFRRPSGPPRGPWGQQSRGGDSDKSKGEHARGGDSEKSKGEHARGGDHGRRGHGDHGHHKGRRDSDRGHGHHRGHDSRRGDGDRGHEQSRGGDDHRGRQGHGHDKDKEKKDDDGGRRGPSRRPRA